MEKFVHTLVLSVFLSSTITNANNFIKEPDNPTNAFQGGSVVLSWVISSKTPIGYIKWLHIKDGAESFITGWQVDNSGNFADSISDEFQGRVVYNNTEISINRLTLADEGTIKLSVVHKDATTYDSSINLAIIVKPYFDDQTSEITDVEDTDVDLSCIAKSKPVAEIAWWRDNKKITANDRYSIESSEVATLETKVTSILTIKSITHADGGIYKCIAISQFAQKEHEVLLNVKYPPDETNLTIVTEFGGEAAELNSNITIMCHANGYPVPRYRLHRGSSALLSSDSGVFHLFNVDIINEGSYWCTSFNDMGWHESDKHNLAIFVIPSVILQLNMSMVQTYHNTNASTSVAIYRGKSVIIHFNISSKPEAISTWVQPNTSNILLVSNTTVLHNEVHLAVIKLELFNATIHDDGSYSLCSCNDFGCTNIKFQINVIHQVEITSLPEEVPTLESATNVGIKCVAQGSPLPTFKWYKNEQLISGSNNDFVITQTTISKDVAASQLNIKIVAKSTFGNYTCEASNTLPELGEKTAQKTTSLVVTRKPYFLTIPPETLIVNSGDNVTLNCTIQAFPKPEVRWLTPDPKSSRMTLHPMNVLHKTTESAVVESILIIRSIATDDFGSYKCVANNTDFRLQSNTTLYVSSPPVWILKPPPNFTAEEYKLDYIECSVKSFPVPHIEWFFSANGTNYSNITSQAMVKVTPTSNYIERLQSRIVFPLKINRGDQGRYNCNVIYRNEVLNQSSFITVEYGPLFNKGSIKGLEEIDVDMNTNVSFTCVVTSKPIANITWYHNEKLVLATHLNTLVNNSTTKTIESIFIVKNISAKDAGEYKCVAENYVNKQLRTNHRSQHMHVLYKPLPSSPSGPVEVNIYRTVSLSCESSAYPPVTNYVWKKDNKTMVFNGSVLIIDPVELNSNGKYSCTPINALGPGTEVVYELIVKVIPYITITPTCKQNLSSMICECRGTGYPAPQIYWTKSTNRTNILSNNGTLVIAVASQSVGTYTCHLKNINGNTSSNVEIISFQSSVSEWSSWNSCNVSCGQGAKERKRTCLISVCNDVLVDVEQCDGVLCPTVAPFIGGWHKDWYIVFWVAIPLLILLFVICCLWAVRRKRETKKPVFVPVNRTLPNPPSIRSLPTQRDIYLPEENQLAAVNSAYDPDSSKRPVDTDVQEVVVVFDEEIESNGERPDYDGDPGNGFYKHYDQAGPQRKTPSKKKRRSKKTNGRSRGITNNTFVDEDGDQVVYATVADKA